MLTSGITWPETEHATQLRRSAHVQAALPGITILDRRFRIIPRHVPTAVVAVLILALLLVLLVRSAGVFYPLLIMQLIVLTGITLSAYWSQRPLLIMSTCLAWLIVLFSYPSVQVVGALLWMVVLAGVILFVASRERWRELVVLQWCSNLVIAHWLIRAEPGTYFILIAGYLAFIAAVLLPFAFVRRNLHQRAGMAHLVAAPAIIATIVCASISLSTAEWFIGLLPLLVFSILTLIAYRVHARTSYAKYFVFAALGSGLLLFGGVGSVPTVAVIITTLMVLSGLIGAVWQSASFRIAAMGFAALSHILYAFSAAATILDLNHGYEISSYFVQLTAFTGFGFLVTAFLYGTTELSKSEYAMSSQLVRLLLIVGQVLLLATGLLSFTGLMLLVWAFAGLFLLVLSRILQQPWLRVTGWLFVLLACGAFSFLGVGSEQVSLTLEFL